MLAMSHVPHAAGSMDIHYNVMQRCGLVRMFRSTLPANLRGTAGVLGEEIKGEFNSKGTGSIPISFCNIMWQPTVVL